MTKKIAVTLKPYERVPYLYQKLKICRKCNHYTVLGDKVCAACGKSALTPVEQRTESLVRRRHWRMRILFLIPIGVALPFSEALWHSILLIVVGLALSAYIWTLQKKATPALRRIQLQKMFQQHAGELAAGLAIDHRVAIGVFQGGDKPRTYEMLREIGMFVRHDGLRIEQIMLLQTFRLRKDMDLMIEPLLMDAFSPDLAEYIGEIAKLRRDLIKENTFRYVLQYESHIMQMHGGPAIMAAVAGAAVRKSRYIRLYPYLLIRYARLLPKERFLRLYRYLQSPAHAGDGPLYDEVMSVFEAKYKWDPDFQNVKSH